MTYYLNGTFKLPYTLDEETPTVEDAFAAADFELCEIAEILGIEGFDPDQLVTWDEDHFVVSVADIELVPRDINSTIKERLDEIDEIAESCDWLIITDHE